MRIISIVALITISLLLSFGFVYIYSYNYIYAFKPSNAPKTEKVLPASENIIAYQFVKVWGSEGTGDGEFYSPEGIAIDSSNGDVYVVDSGNYRIQKFDSNGNFITKWGSPGTGDGEFDYINGIAVDPSSGDVYVADSDEYMYEGDPNQNRIQKFDSNGKFITKWGNNGTGDGEFFGLIGIAVDPSSGDVYVADTNNHRVQKFDSNGNFITKWESGSPYGIAVDSSSGDVYVTPSSGDVYSYDYIDNSYINDRVQKFDSNGNFITKWGSKGTGDGQFNSPINIAVDSTGYVYVTDSYNHRVQKFDSNGNFITKWGSNGVGNGEFSLPYGIAVDSSSGDVYVVDSGNNRIQVFASTK